MHTNRRMYAKRPLVLSLQATNSLDGLLGVPRGCSHEIFHPYILARADGYPMAKAAHQLRSRYLVAVCRYPYPLGKGSVEKERTIEIEVEILGYQ